MKTFAERTGWVLMGAAGLLAVGAAVAQGLGVDIEPAIAAGYLLVAAAMLLIGWGQQWAA